LKNLPAASAAADEASDFQAGKRQIITQATAMARPNGGRLKTIGMRSPRIVLPSNPGCCADPSAGNPQPTEENFLMKPIRSMPLLVAIAIISGLIIVVTQLRLHGFVSLRTGQLAAYSTICLNAVIAILGFWTQHSTAWAAYLLVSFLTLFLIGAATPIGGLWILMVVILDSLAHG
jgi:hypothetical protein